MFSHDCSVLTNKDTALPVHQDFRNSLNFPFSFISGCETGLIVSGSDTSVCRVSVCYVKKLIGCEAVWREPPHASGGSL